MTGVIHKSEVIQHLLDLGYTDINTDEIDNFIQELKTLIESEEGIDVTVYSEAPEVPEQIDSTPNVSFNSSASRKLTSTPRAGHESKRQMVKRKLLTRDSDNRVTIIESYVESSYDGDKSSVASPGAEDVESTCIGSSESSRTEYVSYSDESSKDKENRSQQWTSQENTSDGASTYTGESSYTAFSTASGYLKPPKSSLPLPQARPPQRNVRCDPVALYHKYNKQWSNLKLPGTDSRNDVRWNIRGWMLENKPAIQPRQVSRPRTAPATNRWRI